MSIWSQARAFFSPNFQNTDEFTVSVPEVASKAAMAGGIFRENIEFDPDADDPINMGGHSPWKQIIKRVSRDMSETRHDRAQEIAYNLFETNPLAKRIIEITADYVVGTETGFVVTEPEDSEQERMQNVLNAFWFDHVNRLDFNLYNMIRDLLIFGEQFYPVYVNPKDGHVRLGFIDPKVVTEVITSPENASQPVALKVRKPNGNGSPEDYDFYKVIAVDEDPTSDSFGYRVGLYGTRENPDPRDYITLRNTVTDQQETHKFVGAVFFFSINKVLNANRGRSILLTTYDWLDAYDELLFGEIDRMKLLRNVVWDVSVEGATEEDLARLQAANPPPVPGTVKFHNEKIVWRAVTPDLKNNDLKTGSDVVLTHVATGGAIPKTWLNSVLDSNRATSNELGEPAFKHMSTLQNQIRYILNELLGFQLDQAAIRGVVRKRKDRELWPLRFVLPELRPKDLKTAADTALVMAQALEFALNNFGIDRETYQRVMIVLLAPMGIEINLEEMQANIEEDKKQQIAEQEAKMQMEQKYAPKPLAPALGVKPVQSNGGRQNGAAGKPVQPRNASQQASRVNPSSRPPSSRK